MHYKPITVYAQLLLIYLCIYYFLSPILQVISDRYYKNFKRCKIKREIHSEGGVEGYSAVCAGRRHESRSRLNT